MPWRSSGQFVVDPDYSSPMELAEGFQVGSDWDGESVFSSDFTVRPDADVYGTVEHTQSIQFFPSFHPDGFVSPGRGDNDVRLIVNKTTVLRLYPWPNPGLGASEIRGWAYVRPLGAAYWDEAIADYNGPIQVRPRQQIDRGQANHTLNFRIPRERCHGAIEVRIDVYDPQRGYDPNRPQTFRTVAFRELVFQKAKPMRLFLWGVRWSLGTPAGVLVIPAPTRDQIESRLQWTRRAFPIPGFIVEGYRELDDEWNLDSGDAWSRLLTQLSTERSNMGHGDTDIIHLGVQLRDDPWCIDQGFLGWWCDKTRFGLARPGARVAAAIYRRTVIAHELAHLFGRGHALGCKNDLLHEDEEDIDYNYPRYFGRQTGTIGEYGLHTFTGSVYGPGNYRDVMSYCDDRWISPYTYEGLMQSFLRRP